MSRIILGVAGGISAYKSCYLVRLWRESGHDVTVVPTENALKFVGMPTWEALSGKPVPRGLFCDTDKVTHVRLGQEADLVVIAPATADLLARAAQGQANDLITNVLLTAQCPVLFAPGMHTEMWLNPATVANVALLRSRGYVVMEPATGRLTGADTGIGRLPEPADIFAAAVPLLDPAIATQVKRRDFSGLKVAISAGGTREPVDPVRFLGNRSSGKMGIELARAAALRGAEVTLVTANISEPLPANCRVESVETTADLAATMTRLSPVCDVVIMAAAPADYRVQQVADIKIKKTGGELSIALTETQDILASLVANRVADCQTIVGFAAETAASAQQDLVELGKQKLARKGCDLLVLNDVSAGGVFGKNDNKVQVISGSGIVGAATGAKNYVAHEILNAITQYREGKEAK